MDSYYDVAQICMNGHEITTMYKSSPQFAKKFCKNCGATTTTKCQRCATSIKGYYHVDGVIGGFAYEIPAYCEECGNPFPWTQLKFEAVEGLIDLASGFSDEDRKALKDCLPDIARSTPKSELAAIKFKKLVIKSKDYSKTILQKVVTDLAAEQTKTLFLSIAKELMQ